MRISILMATVGGGHRSIAIALKDTLLGMVPRGAEVVITDLLELIRPGGADQAFRLYGPCIRRAPALYGGVYHLSEHPLVYPAVRASTSYIFTDALKQLLQEQEPDVVVTNYPLANRALLDAISDLGLDIPSVALATELVSLHPSWGEPGFDRWTVATPEAREAVLRLGVPPERVSLLGLPVHQRFGRVSRSPEDLRADWGLEPERPTVLVVAGAEGAGPLSRLVPAIVSGSPECQVIVVCGRNAETRRRLEAMDLRVPALVLGFVEHIPELMHAADVVVTKGGPQSIAEALASKRPLVVFDSLPGQEEGNVEYVERHGVGLDGRTTAGARHAVRRLLRDGRLRAAMADQAAALGRPDAARSTAQLVLSLAMAAPRYERVAD